jgi:putative thiamine transport system permease protein
VLWAIYAVLPEKRLAQQKIVLQTLGYGRFQTLSWLILQLSRLSSGGDAGGAGMVAVGRGRGDRSRARQPATLAVLAWQWLSQGDAQQQAKGTLLCLLLLLLLAALAALGYGSGRHGVAHLRTSPERAPVSARPA